MVAIADMVMSLDNVIAIAAAAKGSWLPELSAMNDAIHASPARVHGVADVATRSRLSSRPMAVDTCSTTFVRRYQRGQQT